MKGSIWRWLAIVSVTGTSQLASGGSATWNLNPANADWNTATNWTPATIPNTQADTATFGSSNIANLTVGEWSDGSGETDTMVHGIVFAPGAPSYTITVTPVFEVGYPSILEIFNGGVTNNSGLMQNLVAASSGTTQACARIYFNSFGSAGENLTITNQGGDSADGDSTYGAFTSFEYNSSAGKAILINQGSTAGGTISGGATLLLFNSNAESATFTNNPGTVSNAAAGNTVIQTTGNIGSSTFICNPATVPGAEGGWIEYDGGTAAGAIFDIQGSSVTGAQAGQIYVYGGSGDATFVANGGNGSNAPGGLIDLFALPFSAQTVVMANGGSNGGEGAVILVEGAADVQLPQFQVFNNGMLDLTNSTSDVAIGSLSGSGVVLLGGHTLSVGNNNLSTTFSGIIQQTGSLTKSGTGTLALSGKNSYNGVTTIDAGTLMISNRSGSATGTGPVEVNAGTLGGKGIILGAVTIGTGTGTGAFLAPSVGSNQPATLTLKKAVTLKADSTYIYKLNTNNTRADQVIVRGVTIESGAQFSFQPVANKRLAAGTVFTALNNTAATSISGTFGNLPDSSTFTAGRNNYQASYTGGDGNDLTLTVVP